MILEPDHETEERSAVRSLTPEAEDEASAVKTETEAPESTRKWWTACPEDRPEKNMWNQKVGKMHPPAGQLVSQPRIRCTTLLGLVSMIPMKVSRNSVRSKKEFERQGPGVGDHRERGRELDGAPTVRTGHSSNVAET